MGIEILRLTYMFNETLCPSWTSFPSSPHSPDSLPVPLPSSIQVSSPSPPESPSPFSVSSSSNGLSTAPMASTLPVLLVAPVAPPVAPPAPSHPMITQSKNSIHKPKSLPTDFLAKPPPKAFVSSTGSLEVEPTCFTLVSKSPQWREAMNAKFTALMRVHGLWFLISPTWNLLDVILLDVDGFFILNVNLMAILRDTKPVWLPKAFIRRNGVFYDDTFSPVIKPTTIRIV